MPAPITVSLPIKQPAPIQQLSPRIAPLSITALGPIETFLPSCAVVAIIAESAISSAGKGVVSKIWANFA